MMTHEQDFTLSALRTALRPESSGLPARQASELDTAQLVRIIRRNGILPTVYPALAGYPELQNALRDQLPAEASHAVSEDYEGRRILQQLNSAGLDCIGLKGWELRKLYPQFTMRQMADLDILVRPYDYPTIRERMAALGYTADEESPWKHDNFAKDTIKVEMHKRLTDDSGPIRGWERGMWERALPSGEGEHILRMSDEDFFIFHIVHMHKDFLNGSLGLRRIADTWLLTRAHPEMDREYIDAWFEKMGLSLFAERMTALAKATMGETGMDENSEIMLAHAFEHGIYGSGKSYKLGRIAAMSSGSLRSGKLRSLLAAVFLPYARMKAQFPTLEKLPILLPWFWAVRIVSHLRGDLKEQRRMLDYSGVSEADFSRMRRFFKAGGC